MLHKWNRRTNKLESANACKGHKRSVDCVAVNSSSSVIASGSYDAQVSAFTVSEGSFLNMARDKRTFYFSHGHENPFKNCSQGSMLWYVMAHVSP
jgi:WD40 repeat protein